MEKSYELAKEVAKVLDSKKARDIKVLKVHDLTVLTDYFVLATGNSNTQVGSLVDTVEYMLEEKGVRPTRIEGKMGKNWVVMDYDNVVVHIFQPQARDYYSLEHMWADAQQVNTDFLNIEE